MEAIVLGSAGVLIFCYTSLMPHMNFNIDVMAEWMFGDLTFENLDELSKHVANCLAPEDNRRCFTNCTFTNDGSF
eukprot:SAG22_NODE_2609_length_2385_cov_2.938758_1_plen_75_part_00